MESLSDFITSLYSVPVESISTISKSCAQSQWSKSTGLVVLDATGNGMFSALKLNKTFKVRGSEIDVDYVLTV